MKIHTKYQKINELRYLLQCLPLMVTRQSCQRRSALSIVRVLLPYVGSVAVAELLESLFLLDGGLLLEFLRLLRGLGEGSA